VGNVPTLSLSYLPCGGRWLSEGFFTTSNERYDMYDEEAQRKEAEEISDLEAQWFRGFPKVVEVVNLVTEGDIVGEVCPCGTDVVAPGEVCDYCATIALCECGSHDCFWCAPTVATFPTDADIPF